MSDKLDKISQQILSSQLYNEAQIIFYRMEADVIHIAETIFQNVGIKRWIDDIQPLKNQQIYYEICSIIFPDNIIKMLQINRTYSDTGQKMQQLISMISKIIKNDLPHISGHAIVQGNLKHLKHFLQLLEALSQAYINYDTKSDTQSTPETYSNKVENDQSFYTVIGIADQFQIKSDQQELFSQTISKEVEDEKSNKNQNKDSHADNNFPKIQSKRILNQKKLKNKNKSKSVITVHNKKKEIDKYWNPTKTLKSSKSINTQNKAPSSLRKIPMKSKKFNYINKTNKIMEKFEKRKNLQMNKFFKGWKKDKKYMLHLMSNKINFQTKITKKFLDAKLLQRQQIVSSLKKNPTQTTHIINAFKMQQSSYKKVKKQTRLNQLELANKIISNKLATEVQLQKNALSTIVNFM